MPGRVEAIRIAPEHEQLPEPVDSIEVSSDGLPGDRYFGRGDITLVEAEALEAFTDETGIPQRCAPAELHAFFTHFRMWVPTATSVPSWFLMVMSPVERRRSMSIALMRYSTVTVSPK